MHSINHCIFNYQEKLILKLSHSLVIGSSLASYETTVLFHPMGRFLYLHLWILALQYGSSLQKTEILQNLKILITP